MRIVCQRQRTADHRVHSADGADDAAAGAVAVAAAMSSFVGRQRQLTESGAVERICQKSVHTQKYTRLPDLAIEQGHYIINFGHIILICYSSETTQRHYKLNKRISMRVHPLWVITRKDQIATKERERRIKKKNNTMPKA